MPAVYLEPGADVEILKRYIGDAVRFLQLYAHLANAFILVSRVSTNHLHMCHISAFCFGLTVLDVFTCFILSGIDCGRLCPVESGRFVAPGRCLAIAYWIDIPFDRWLHIITLTFIESTNVN